jgi:uncharacterized protein
MEPAFDRESLLSNLRILPFAAALAFALSCAERLYPNYIRFSREHGWGDPSVLRAALDYGWGRLLGNTNETDAGELRQQCEDATPDTEDFDSIYISPGLDAACAASMVLDIVQNRDPGIVADIASLCRDTVDMYIQEIEKMSSQDRKREQKILIHPLMQRELSRQREDISTVADLLTEGDGLASVLRDRWRAPERSNIDLS